MQKRNITDGLRIYRGTGNTWVQNTQYEDGEYIVLDKTACYSEASWSNQKNYDLVHHDHTIMVFGGVSATEGGSCILAAKVGRRASDGVTYLAPARAVPLNQVRGEYMACVQQKAAYENAKWDEDIVAHQAWQAGKVIVDNLEAALKDRGITLSARTQFYNRTTVTLEMDRVMAMSLTALLNSITEVAS
jgi:hypothetical protein